jgi:general secretion pathway protein D
MVYIEALIMEVNVTKNFEVGVQWTGLKDTGHVSGFPGSSSAAFAGFQGTMTKAGTVGLSTTTTGTTGSVILPQGLALGIMGANIKIGNLLFPNLGAVLQAYRADSDVSILSTPQILTLDNEDAEINVGQNVPYLTKQERTVTDINYSNYEYRDVGVYLKITPHISEEGQVRLKIDQSVTKVISGAADALPTTLKRTAKTTVVVKDQETVVIGGLLGDSTDMGTTKVPFFGDIPLLGWLFKTKSNYREKTNLFIFLTPHVIRTADEAAELTEMKRSGEAGVISEGVVHMREKRSPEK